jgi:cell fate regulator YaaT (PSP1 superfamily)
MALPGDQKPFIGVEIRFKNGRKHFYKNSEKLSLSMGDVVATEAMSGHDIGIVTLTGELVKVQMKKKKQPEKVEELPKIYRKATQKDIDIWQTVRAKEPEIQKRSREIAIHLGLKMKISDIEYQGDGSKTTFYYTAEERVDFRQLIRDFSSAFSTRVEMKQVGFRHEAARLGGIGSCGRELCCSTWLTDFRSVKTSAARYQQLSLNPQKLAGQCGKLKCCLNYELDTYLDALKDIPKNDIKLITEKGTAVCQKTDIFKRILWYGYEKQGMNWHQISVDKANEIIALNKKGEKVSCLEDFEEVEHVSESKIFENVVGQDSLTRFDKPKSKNNQRRKNKSKNRNQSPNQNRKSKKNA